jgi:hypothetical protein
MKVNNTENADLNLRVELALVRAKAEYDRRFAKELEAIQQERKRKKNKL